LLRSNQTDFFVLLCVVEFFQSLLPDLELGKHLERDALLFELGVKKVHIVAHIVHIQQYLSVPLQIIVHLVHRHLQLAVSKGVSQHYARSLAALFGNDMP
jgi:hypothetical protein